MIFIEKQFHFIGLFILTFVHKTIEIDSIQCCTGVDNTCSSKPVDCPSNVCFKLVLGTGSEERGCLEDLLKLLNFGNNDRTLNERNGLTSGPLNDQCHRLGKQENGISLCKCTSNLCNSSSKIIDLQRSILTFIILSFHYSLRVFLS